MKLSALIALVLLPILTSTTVAQNTIRIVVLPFGTAGVDSITARTSSSILRTELGRSGRYTVLEEGQTPDASCIDMSCAIAAVAGLRADRVVYGKLSRLGSKIIIDYVVADIATRKQLALGGISATSVEDIENVLRRIAGDIIGDPPPASAFSDTGTIEPQRVLNAPAYRSAVGIGIGEMSPIGGYGGDRSRSFVLDSRFSFDYSTYAFTVLGSWRLGPMVNFGACYYFGQGSVAPYVGGGVGYHFIFPTYFLLDPYTTDSRSGFQAIASAGLALFRMGDMRLLANLDYMLTADGFGDQALVLTIGIMGAANLRF